eukprot:2486635-Prymnesium_polylepis.1
MEGTCSSTESSTRSKISSQRSTTSEENAEGSDTQKRLRPKAGARPPDCSRCASDAAIPAASSVASSEALAISGT